MRSAEIVRVKNLTSAATGRIFIEHDGDVHIGDGGVVADIRGVQVVSELRLVLHEANVLAQRRDIRVLQLWHLVRPQLLCREAGVLLAPPVDECVGLVVFRNNHDDLVALSQCLGHVADLERSVVVVVVASGQETRQHRTTLQECSPTSATNKSRE